MYGADRYQQSAATTAGPAQLVLMLFDGALVRLEVAAEAIDAGTLDTAHDNIVRVQAIVDELNLTLDLDQGGAIAANLRELYVYCSSRLIDANLAKDVTILREVAAHLQGLRDAWDTACVRAAVQAVG